MTAGGGGVQIIFSQALTPNVGGLVMVISTVGQFFCTVACMTSTTRMLFAFSRDGAVPGSQYWSKLNANRVPVYGVIAVRRRSRSCSPCRRWSRWTSAARRSPVAFFAVVSIGVVGLYVAFGIPIFLRWKAGPNFTPGGWTLGSKYKWMCIVAVVEIAVTSFIALLPTSSGGAPWYPGSPGSTSNYTEATNIGWNR